ncbi:MAG: hypothetical protein WBG92_25465 [Thiohalocapsa sp.]
MSVSLSLSAEVYLRLEKLAVGFDTPSDVIERLLNEHDAKGKDDMSGAASRPPRPIPVCHPPPEAPSERLYENREIQQRITAIAKTFTKQELDRLCDLQVSKKEFNLSFPLFVRVPSETNQTGIREALEDEKGYKRWTSKFRVVRDGYIYAVCTQWYARQDAYVKRWLEAHESRHETP